MKHLKIIPPLFEEPLDCLPMGVLLCFIHACRLKSIVYTYVYHSYLVLCTYYTYMYYICIFSRSLCKDTYPDEVCRGNYSLHKHDPPLLFDLHSDPSELYALVATEHSQLLALIDEVKSCGFCSIKRWVLYKQQI